MQEKEEALIKDFRVKRVQLDAFWLYVGNKGEKNYLETAERGQFMRATMLDVDSRCGWHVPSRKMRRKPV